ncbi:hypothetical protein Tco_0910853 [Tanacetum coccineum]|uniref:Uncharacterized protein n=1 Tax=Tanacetum coccineum TaxID=301880 RepID=A0ABQ5CUH5_9ASTR
MCTSKLRLMVTHTEISSPFEDLSDIGSPGVVGPEHEGLPWMLDDPYVQVTLQAPPSPDYIPGPEEPQSPPLLDFVQRSPDYVLESDPEADLEEDDDEDPEEDPVDYPADGGDDGDDEDESSEDDEDDDEVDIEADDDEEEEEHPAPGLFGRSIYILSRISILAPIPTPVHVLSPSPPASPIRPLGYQAAMIRLRAEATSTSHSLPLPPPIILSHTRLDVPLSGTPPLHLLSTDRREDRPELPYHLERDYGFVATMDREIRHDLERDVGYGITDSWDEIVEAMHGTPVVTDVVELSQRMTEFETSVRRDTDEVYTRSAHARTARLMETKSRMSREAWRRSMDASDLAHAEVMSLHTTVLAQQS